MRIGSAEFEGAHALSISYEALGPGQVATATTPTFSPRDVLDMRTYDLMATPLVYPGQTIAARVVAPSTNRGAVTVRLRLRVYDDHDDLTDVDGEPVTIAPGQEAQLRWTVPEFDGQPIGEIGLAIAAEGRRADGSILVDFVRWDGTPALTLHRPKGDSDFWRMSWVNGVSFFSKRFPPSFRISQGQGRGDHYPRHSPVDRLHRPVSHHHPSRRIRWRCRTRSGPETILWGPFHARRPVGTRASARR